MGYFYTLEREAEQGASPNTRVKQYRSFSIVYVSVGVEKEKSLLIFF